MFVGATVLSTCDTGTAVAWTQSSLTVFWIRPRLDDDLRVNALLPLLTAIVLVSCYCWRYQPLVYIQSVQHEQLIYNTGTNQIKLGGTRLYPILFKRL